MDIHNFLATKREGRTHSPKAISEFVRAITADEVEDYHVAAWLMAAYINGLDGTETSALTIAMATSGETLKFENVPRPIIDKHSTGGVGDTTTFLLLPLLAACGITGLKLSGRGLGFTGGTLDKLASIPGFRTDLSGEEISRIANEVGCALGGQTANLAPADKKLYALRDATETVSSLPLIAASVMSKKLAVESDGIVLDVKCGSGAFMETKEAALALATQLVAIGASAGRETRALVTDMSQPLNRYVGNALEIRGAIESLDGGLQDQLGQVVLRLAEEMADIAGVSVNFADAVSSGRVHHKLQEWISAQGGDPGAPLPRAPVVETVLSDRDGYIAAIDCASIGKAARALGAGRATVVDKIDPSVGIVMQVSIGDPVSVGAPLYNIHAKTSHDATSAQNSLASAIQFAQDPVEPKPLILATIK